VHTAEQALDARAVDSGCPPFYGSVDLRGEQDVSATRNDTPSKFASGAHVCQRAVSACCEALVGVLALTVMISALEGR
jgi:hypothetical protein